MLADGEAEGRVEALFHDLDRGDPLQPVAANGLAFLVPVALSAGRHPESRLYPRARRAYVAWGVVLYLLGTVLAVQVAEVWSYVH